VISVFDVILAYSLDSDAFKMFLKLADANFSLVKYDVGCICSRGPASVGFQSVRTPFRLRSSGIPVPKVKENKSKYRRGPIPMNGTNGSLVLLQPSLLVIASWCNENALLLAYGSI